MSMAINMPLGGLINKSLKGEARLSDLFIKQIGRAHV